MERKKRDKDNTEKPVIRLEGFIKPEEEEVTDVQGVDDLEDLFNNNSESSILKELFNDKNFKTKTDISSDEISIISRLYLMSEITRRPKLKTILDQFLILRISKDRKSRSEFVESNKERRPENPGGLLQGLLGGRMS